MAKLGSYYGLCPLIDQKNLLGISEDIENGYIIITLGQNIAVKYRLSDQKQVQSWRTKDKFTAPVVFNKEENKYISIFNQVSLRLWMDDAIEHLDKIKKYKFTKPIYTIINCNEKSFIVFKNGRVLTLKDALEQRKNLYIKDVINMDDEKIVDTVKAYVGNTIYICLIVKGTSTTNCIWTSFTDGVGHSDYHKMVLTRANSNLSGYTFCEMYSKYLYFLTLWSDGHLYSYPVAGPINQELKNLTEEFGFLFATIESISCKQNVAMIALRSDHIAIYGADYNQEGASLIIYNMQFKVSQSKQTFKMFSNTNKIWCIKNTLLLCTGQNLAVVPFHINTEQLSQLVGSHKIDISEMDVQQSVAVGKWDIEIGNNNNKPIPPKIKSSVLNCLGQGLSEITICDYLIPIYIENSDIEAIKNCINYFKDISEQCVVKILSFLIENHLTYNDFQNPNRNLLLDKILSLPFTNVLLLHYMKVGVNINTALQLLRYISFLLSSEYCLPDLDFVQTENNLIKWGCVILDANYQKFLLTCDSVVQEVLSSFNKLVQKYLLCLSDFKTVEPFISDVLRGRIACGNRRNNNVKYSVEEIKLY